MYSHGGCNLGLGRQAAISVTVVVGDFNGEEEEQTRRGAFLKLAGTAFCRAAVLAPTSRPGTSPADSKTSIKASSCGGR
jgi:hypothetical protein